MKPDTPLPEVALMLPRNAANILLEEAPVVQERILTLVRAVLVYWEGERIQMDPIAWTAAVDALVASATPMARRIEELDLQLRLLGVVRGH